MPREREREKDPDAKRFGEILSRLRIARSWTLGDLGEASGMHPDLLGLLERGMNLPSLRVRPGAPERLSRILPPGSTIPPFRSRHAERACLLQGSHGVQHVHGPRRAPPGADQSHQWTWVDAGRD